MFRLDNKVALVTGANRGLGAGIALGIAEAGANVVLHDIGLRRKHREANPRETGARTHCLTADFPLRAQVDRMAAEAVAAMGGLDILVNNAGIILRAPAAEHSDEYWDAVIEINLTAVFRLCRVAGSHMLARGNGKIVNIPPCWRFRAASTFLLIRPPKAAWRRSPRRWPMSGPGAE